MKSKLKLIYGLVFIATNVMAASTIEVCKDGNECKKSYSVESLEIVPDGKGNSVVKVFSSDLYSKVGGEITKPPPLPPIDPPITNGKCPAPLLAQKFINYPIGTNTQFPDMVKGQVLVMKLVPPANHTGKIFWGPAVGTGQVTSKIAVISTCPGVINSNIDDETVYPCRRSRNEDSLWYSTEANPSFDKCKLQAKQPYYVNIFSGYDLTVSTSDTNAHDLCPSGKRCDITLNVK